MEVKLQEPSVTYPKISSHPPARLVVIDVLYYQPPDNANPSQHESRFVRPLLSDEQVYQRKFKVGSDKWQLIDTGWVTTPSMVIISNDEGRNLQAIPDELESKAIKSRIVKLGFGVSSGVMIIPPGESIRFCPSDSKEVVLRCEYQSAKCTITVFPN